MLRFAALFVLLFVDWQSWADDRVIDALDELRFRQPSAKGVAALVPGHAGQAIEFKFDKDCQNVFFTSNIRGTPEWDKAAGFSFWVKGDGSKDVGALQLIYDDDYAVRYEYAFPLQDTQWHQVVVAWHDLVPVLPGKNSNLLDPKGSNKPSKLSALWVGKWWHWRDYPAHTFALDDLRLEPEIATKETASAAGLVGVRAKLRKGEPVTIVTMGDSLTDTRHWANRQVDWPTLLKQALEAKYKSQVTIVNPAIGGTQLRQGLVQIPRWLADTPSPDLVTVCYGGNDWEAGMRGPQFLETYRDGVDRIRRATGGKADVLILSTVPSVERWTTAGELAEACRQASQDRKAGLADLEQAFHREGEKDREKLFASDKVHLGPAGHKLVAETVLRAIEDGDP
jgi:lysophospholipase L1-like esterase